MSVPLAQIPAPHDTASLTLVEQLVQWARRRIEERVFRPGMRMPSIRKLALDKGVSRFTVVEAYERLVAQGFLESRRGSGFYVRERQGGAATVTELHPRAETLPAPGPRCIHTCLMPSSAHSRMVVSATSGRVTGSS